MFDLASFFLTFGLLFALGLLTHLVARPLHLPRATLLMIAGLLVGPSAFGLLPDIAQEWFPAVANAALVMIGFLLGEQLTTQTFREHGRDVLVLSLGVVIGTVLVVFLGLWAVGLPLAAALLLAGVALATDPAATVDVTVELQADGSFTQKLKGIVAIDDLWGLLAFGIIMAAVSPIAHDGSVGEAIRNALWELGGAFGVGLVVGVPGALLTGRLQAGEPSLVEALAMVFVCVGISLELEVSTLIAAMTMGATVANLARHHDYPFNAIVGIEWPFLILFFILAGASFELGALADVGLAGVAYVLLRIVGRIVGGWTAGVSFGAEPETRRWMGAALLPQAGVAIGMALVGAQRFPELAETILTIVIASTVFFEVLGPLVTRLVLVRVGEAGEVATKTIPD